MSEKDRYKEPIIPERATERQAKLMKAYSKISEVVQEGSPDAHSAWLVVDNQYFIITPYGTDSAEEASWHCHMLSMALEKMITKEHPDD